MKVLIIEDNPINMKLASDLLTRTGYTVLQASEAETGMLVDDEKESRELLNQHRMIRHIRPWFLLWMIRNEIENCWEHCLPPRATAIVKRPTEKHHSPWHTPVNRTSFCWMS